MTQRFQQLPYQCQLGQPLIVQGFQPLGYNVIERLSNQPCLPQQHCPHCFCYPKRCCSRQLPCSIQRLLYQQRLGLPQLGLGLELTQLGRQRRLAWLSLPRPQRLQQLVQLGQLPFPNQLYLIMRQVYFGRQTTCFERLAPQCLLDQPCLGQLGNQLLPCLMWLGWQPLSYERQLKLPQFLPSELGLCSELAQPQPKQLVPQCFQLAMLLKQFRCLPMLVERQQPLAQRQLSFALPSQHSQLLFATFGLRMPHE